MKNSDKTKDDPILLDLDAEALRGSKARWLPLILVVLIAGYLASKTISRPIAGPMNLTAVALTPVSYEGRVQPLDSLARNELLIISKRTTFRSDWLRPAQVKDWAGLAKKIVADGKAAAVSPGKRIWSLFTAQERALLESAATATEITPQMQNDLLHAFNGLLDDETRPGAAVHDAEHGHDHDVVIRFYDLAHWKDLDIGDELKSSLADLAKWDKRDPHAEKPMARPLTRPQVIDLNRKLLSKAFPDFIKAGTAVQEPAIVWLMDVFADQQRATTHRVFRIEHERILELLKLERRPGDFRYAIDEFLPSMKELDREANLARNTPSKEHDAYQDGLVDLAQNLTRFASFSQFQRPYWVPPPSLKSDWKNFEEIAEESRKTGNVNPDAQMVMTFLQAYKDGDVAKFNDGVRSHNDRIKLGFASDASRAGFETFFNRVDLFSHLTNLYVFVFLLVMISWLLFGTPVWAIALRKAAFYLLIMFVSLHGVGMLARMYLMDRPLVFVTNLYASAIFIGFTSIVVALLIEKVQKLGIGSAVAATIGFITGIIALHLRGEGDTLEMQQAVLDTNFWLATHVTTVTFGYAATYLAGAFGIAFVLAGLFTQVLGRKNTRNGDPAGAMKYVKSGVPIKIAVGLAAVESATVKGETLDKGFARIIYGTICFALFLSFVGTVLGGIWADQSWGRFWGWDPKENGAVMIVIWNALILHARWGGMVQARGMAVLAIIGNIVTTWSWFGTNQLGAGLHSYGFMDKAVFWILVFCASQLVLVGLGLLPMSAWRSFNDRKDKPARDFAGAVTAASLTLLFVGLFAMAMRG